MTTIILVIILLIAGYIIFINQNQNTHLNEKRSSEAKKPTKLIENNKLILAQTIDKEYLIKNIKSFCNLYNQEDYVAVMKLVTLENNTYAIVFPYDIDDTTFGFLVNYLAFPIDYNAEKQVKVKGWLTMGGKKVMMQNSDEKDEFDGVLITDENNLTIFSCFDGTDKVKKDSNIVYHLQPISIDAIKHQEGEEFY